MGIELCSSSETLDRAYAAWLVRSSPSADIASVRRWTNYRYTWRNSSSSQQFESWISSLGGRVVQRDTVRYIQFDTVEQRVYFELTWG